MENPKLYFNDSDLLEAWENVENWLLYPNLYWTDDEPTSPVELDIWVTVPTHVTPSVQKIWHNGAWVTNEVFPFHPTEPPWQSATAYLDYDLVDPPLPGTGNCALINADIGDVNGVWQITGTCFLNGVILNSLTIVRNARFLGSDFENNGTTYDGVFGNWFVNYGTTNDGRFGDGFENYSTTNRGIFDDVFVNYGTTYDGIFGDAFDNCGTTNKGVFGSGFDNEGGAYTNAGVFGDWFVNYGMSSAGVFGNGLYNGGSAVSYGGIYMGANTMFNGSALIGPTWARNITFVADGVTIIAPDVGAPDATFTVLSLATVAQAEILGPLL